MSFWYDRQGKPLTTADFETDKIAYGKQMAHVEELLTDINYKRVAWTEVKIKRTTYHVSTVWLGLDHDYSYRNFDEPNPRPIIFETMIFKVKRDGYREALEYQTRYSTEAQAAKGHLKAIKWLHNAKAT